MTDMEYVLEETSMIYMTDSKPGITQIIKNEVFYFQDRSEQIITDQKILNRIKKLAIPPAWNHVWIVPIGNAHLQATVLTLPAENNTVIIMNGPGTE